MIKRTLSAVTVAAVLAAPAFAQTPAPDAKPDNSSMPALSTPQPQPHDNFVQSEHATDWRGSKLIGAIVYGPDNASIGSVNDVLISNDAKIRAVVIGVGGFLGVGEKNVAHNRSTRCASRASRTPIRSTKLLSAIRRKSSKARRRSHSATPSRRPPGRA
ncbi:MAG: PRC-barrel domain-containing protein [Pseudolabrys sp.]